MEGEIGAMTAFTLKVASANDAPAVSDLLDGIRTGRGTEISDLFAAFADRYPQ